MRYATYAAALCGSLILGGGSALAGSDTAPAVFNSTPPRPYKSVNLCPNRMVPVQTASGIACGGEPTFNFVRVDAVPAGYTGRVWIISEYGGGGYQDLGW